MLFALASGALALLFGVAFGNLLRGLPMHPNEPLTMALFTDFLPQGQVDLLDWYTVLVGLFAVPRSPTLSASPRHCVASLAAAYLSTPRSFSSLFLVERSEQPSTAHLKSGAAGDFCGEFGRSGARKPRHGFSCRSDYGIGARSLPALQAAIVACRTCPVRRRFGRDGVAAPRARGANA